MILLWGIYLALNVLQVALMSYAGLSLFDPLYTFATVATAGCRPTTPASVTLIARSLTGLQSVHDLGGIIRPLYQLLRGNLGLSNRHRAHYLMLLLFVSFAVAAILYSSGTYLDDQNQPDLAASIRYGTFRCVLLTTTGFTTADYVLWPNAAQMMLWVVVFIGACAGSTTSGVKVIHYILIWRFMVAAVKKLFFQPLSVISVRINEQRVNNRVVYLALCYFIANIFIILFGSIVMAISDDLDINLLSPL